MELQSAGILHYRYTHFRKPQIPTQNLVVFVGGGNEVACHRILANTTHIHQGSLVPRPSSKGSGNETNTRVVVIEKPNVMIT